MRAIETKGLTKTYQDKTAVRGLDMQVEQGELYALLGVNGAGKTTTIKMLSCILAPTAGDALLLGDSILRDARQVKAKMNLSPQETAVARNLTVEENLWMIGGIYSMGRHDARAKAEELLSAFGLGEVRRQRAKTLSGGMQRRLSIAMALMTDPSILFLDEPTLGLDVLAKRALWALIQRLKGTLTIILTTHNMEEAQALADRIGILHGGRLAAVGTADALMAQTGTASLEDAFVTVAVEKEAAL